jgi:sugar phosphate permease
VLLSFLFGGDLAWKHVFYISVSISLILGIPLCFFKCRRTALNEEEISISKETLKNTKHAFEEKAVENVDKVIVENIVKVSLWKSIRVLINSRMLLIMISCNAISCLCEILGSWSINFLKDNLDVSNSAAGVWTGVFCVFRYHSIIR